jgi:hypothetical protein
VKTATFDGFKFRERCCFERPALRPTAAELTFESHYECVGV